MRINTGIPRKDRGFNLIELPDRQVLHGSRATGVTSLEHTKVGRLANEQSDGVIITADEGRLQLGTGLSASTLRWLEAYILPRASND